jgi:crotonobetainyl-CoA:carnitine CoA-transferase CaiB-like acyl-CoA transferase
VVVYTDIHWRKFSQMIGRPDLMQEDERFGSMQSRTSHAEVAGDLLARELAKKTSAEWLALLGDADIPACRVNSVDELFDDPHLNAVAFFSDMEHPTEGTLRVARSPMKFSRTPLEIRRLAPALGEFNGSTSVDTNW